MRLCLTRITALLFLAAAIPLLGGCYDPIGEYDNPVDPGYEESGAEASGEQRFTMTGDILGQEVNANSSNPRVNLYEAHEGGIGLRIANRDESSAIEFRGLAALAGPREYTVEVDLPGKLGVWSEIINQEEGFMNTPVDEGSVTFERLDADWWIGSYQYVTYDHESDDGSLYLSVSGEFAVDVGGHDIPESAFDDQLTAQMRDFVVSGNLQGTAVEIATSQASVSLWTHESGHTMVNISGLSEHQESVDREVGINFGLPATADNRTFYSPAVASGLQANVVSPILEEATGFTGSDVLTGNMTMTLADGVLSGDFDFDTEAGDSLNGHFDVPIDGEVTPTSIADLQVTPELLFDIPDSDYEELVYNPDDNTLNVLNHATSEIEIYAMDGTTRGSVATGLSHWSGDQWQNSAGLTVYNNDFLVTAVDDYSLLYSIDTGGGVFSTIPMDRSRYVQGLDFDGERFWMYDPFEGIVAGVATDGSQVSATVVPSSGNWSGLAKPTIDDPLYVLAESEGGRLLVEIDPATGRVIGEGTFDAPSTDAFTGLTSDGTNLYAVANAIYRLNVTAR